MTYACLIFFVGLLLSAFFSGVETGFYRVPRMRLVVDAVGGDRTARGLLWASNHPEAFVATALVGNNVANYLASSAIVAAAGALMPAAGLAAEMTLTLALSPVVFIFGELLPKRAFLTAPYRLLRRCAGGLLVASVALAAPSSVLWLASRALSLATGSSFEPLRVAVRRRELTDAFEEGHAVGLLSPAQRDLAQATFSLGGRPLRTFMTLVARQPRLAARATPEDALRLARRLRADALPIEPSGASKLHEYVRASRIVAADGAASALPTEAMSHFEESTPFLKALTQLESTGQPLAAVVGAGGRVTGYVHLSRMQSALWDAT